MKFAAATDDIEYENTQEMIAMKVRSIPALTLLLVLGGKLAAKMYAEDAKAISPQEACVLAQPEMEEGRSPLV